MDNAVPAQGGTAHAAVIALHIGADQTTVTRQLAGVQQAQLVLDLGTVSTARTYFKHEPPTPLEIENAIMAVEDEVIRAIPTVAGATVLQTRDAGIRAIAESAGVAGGEPLHLSVEAVERQFDLLAALIQGRPAAIAGIPTDTHFAATLLILREFMHHLHCAEILIAP